MAQAHFDLDTKHIGKGHSLETAVTEAIRSLDYPYVSGDEDRNEKSFNTCVSELTDTISGLGKHEASYIDGLFTPGSMLDEVIALLADYEPKDVPWGAPHMDRWRAEAKRAHGWLVSYRREHF
jgi:hypothetical protein